MTEQTRQAVDDYLVAAGKKPAEFLFTGHRAIGRPTAVLPNAGPGPASASGTTRDHLSVDGGRVTWY